MPRGPKITEEYAGLVARDAYFWAWPLVNVYNRRLAYEKVSEPGGRIKRPEPACSLRSRSALTMS